MAAKAGRGRGRAVAAPSHTPEELLAAARSGGAPPVVMATGRDHFSRERFLRTLRGLLITPGFEGFNETVRFGEEVDGSQLASEADMLPFGGGRRLILVRQAERIPERELEPIARWAASPSSTTSLVLSSSEPGPAAAALAGHAARVEFAPPRDYQLAAWLERQAKQERLSLDGETARLIASSMGEDWAGSMSLLMRASIAAAGPGGEPGRITRRIVEGLMERGRDSNLFHLADMVMGRQPAKAIRVLRDLTDAGESGFSLLPRISAQIGRFLAMREAIDGGTPPEEAVRAASPALPPMIRSKTARLVASYDQARLAEALRLVRATDQSIKGAGSGSDVAHIESLIFRIASL